MIPFLAKLAIGPIIRRVTSMLPGRYALGGSVLAGLVVLGWIWWQGHRLDNAREALAECRAEVTSLRVQRQRLREAVDEQNERVRELQSEAERVRAKADHRAREVRSFMVDMRPDPPAEDAGAVNVWTRDLFSR